MSSPAVAARPPLALRGALERASRTRLLAATACLAIVVIAGFVLAAAGAARHTAVVPAAKRAVPGWITGPLAPVSIHLTAAGFFLVLGAMAAGYLGVVVLGIELRARWVVAAVLLLHLAFVLTAPLLSTDVFNYVIYGRIGALHGLDPYAVTPIHVAHDPLYPYIAWRRTRTAYGPLFTLGSYPLAALGPAGALWAFKGIAGMASLGSGALVWAIARRRGVAPAHAVAIFGLNPVLLVWVVAGAHNDLLMLLGALGAVALVCSSRDALGGAALATAVAVKASAGLALPFVIAGARKRRRALAGAAAAATAVLAVAFLSFSDHAVGMLRVLRHEQHLVAFDSVAREVARLFALPGETAAVRDAATLLLLAALAVALVRAVRRADWIATVGWVFCALVACSSWILAWYTVWPLPFAAVTRDRRLLMATLALETYFVLNHLPLFTT